MLFGDLFALVYLFAVVLKGAYSLPVYLNADNYLDAIYIDGTQQSNPDGWDDWRTSSMIDVRRNSRITVVFRDTAPFIGTNNWGFQAWSPYFGFGSYPDMGIGGGNVFRNQNGQWRCNAGSNVDWNTRTYDYSSWNRAISADYNVEISNADSDSDHQNVNPFWEGGPRYIWHAASGSRSTITCIAWFGDGLDRYATGDAGGVQGLYLGWPGMSNAVSSTSGRVYFNGELRTDALSSTRYYTTTEPVFTMVPANENFDLDQFWNSRIAVHVAYVSGTDHGFHLSEPASGFRTNGMDWRCRRGFEESWVQPDYDYSSWARPASRDRTDSTFMNDVNFLGSPFAQLIWTNAGSSTPSSSFATDSEVTCLAWFGDDRDPCPGPEFAHCIYTADECSFFCISAFRLDGSSFSSNPLSCDCAINFTPLTIVRTGTNTELRCGWPSEHTCPAPTTTTSSTSLVTCNNPTGVRNMDTVLTRCANTPAGATCELICLDGYTAVPSKQMTCDSNGQWIDLPRCELVQSCNSPDIPGMDMQGLDCDNDGTNSTRECSVVCLAGYAMVGSEQIICDSGEWGDLPVCVELMEDNSVDIGAVAIFAGVGVVGLLAGGFYWYKRRRQATDQGDGLLSPLNL